MEQIMEHKFHNSNVLPIFLILYLLRILFDKVYGPSRCFLMISPSRCQSQTFDNSEVISEHNNKNQDLGKKETNKGCCLSGQEINMVIERIGIKHCLEGKELQRRWGFKDISGLFEDQEPSLEEVREAFEVFDQNKDGFIDSEELQRVLSGLGLRQGSELQTCSKMIRVYDVNGDGKIDFKEFVKFMLDSF